MPTATVALKARFEVDIRLGPGGNGTDDFGFSALPGGYPLLRQMASSTMPGTSATGGVLRPMAAMLGPALDYIIQSSTGSASIRERLLGQVS